MQSAARAESQYALPETQDPCEPALYAGLRRAVPVIDAAIGKIVRLTGSFQLVAGDSRMQEQLDEFARSVPVGLTGQSLQTFADAYLDSLLTYGNALGEMLIDNRTGYLGGLQTVPAELVQIRPGSHPLERQYWLRSEQESDSIRIARPERILFTALNPPPGGVYGVSVLRGLPALSHILLRIYACIGQNYDRMGNVRYAVTYKPSNDPNERAYAGERARQIAKEWSEGMRAGAAGEIRDFICAGDVDIRVIGADNAPAGHGSAGAPAVGTADRQAVHSAVSAGAELVIHRAHEQSAGGYPHLRAGILPPPVRPGAAPGGNGVSAARRVAG